MDLITLQTFVPEIFLSICILFQLVFNSILVTNIKYNFPILNKEVFAQTFFILFCLLLLLLNLKVEAHFSNFLFINDLGTCYTKILFVFSCLFFLLSVLRSFTIQKLNFFEFFSLLLLAILSLLLLISVSDMMSAYLVIEMQALSFYVLSAFKRNSAFSSEAGLKYFIIGSFMSGIFLFGCSLIYGLLGTLNFNALSLLFHFKFNGDYLNFYIILSIGISLITFFLLFKLAIAPFHFWAPDVYEGSPLSTTIIFSILPKLGIFSFFIRWLSIISSNFSEIFHILFYFGILSVFIGSFFAIRQKRIKRLLIYSSIAQGGFLIVGLSVNTLNSLIAVYFFLVVYIITSILLWSHVSFFYSFQNKIELFNGLSNKSLFLVNLANFFKVNILWSFSFVLIFFSLAGVPPLSGFLSKIFILFSILEEKNIFGSLLLILISAVSVFYYLRILKILFFESKEELKRNNKFQVLVFDSYSESDCLVTSFLLFLLVFIFFFPCCLILICEQIVMGSTFF